jgi:hypothetical protein
MNAKDAIQLVVEGKAPEGWATTRGVYANLSNYPREIKYYVKCPKCGLVHGDFTSLKDAHGKRLCDLCNLDAINKLKDEIQKVIHEPDHKPKEMAKIVGEAIERFDPFDEPPEGEGVPVPPEDEPYLEPTDTKGEIERLLLGNWVDVALRQFADEESHDLSDLQVDEHWGQGDYDPDNLEATTRFKVDVGNVEWLFFKDEDTAESYALEIVRTDLETEPGIFTRDWLRQFVDEDKLRAAIGDPHEDWENEIRDLDYDDLLDKMTEEGYVDDGDEQFYDEDGDHREETPELFKALDDIRDNFIEREKPTWEPWEWLEDIYGKEQAQEEALKMVGIDVDAAAKDAVATDGWPHFVARYDGHSHTLEDGAVYCRVN